MNRLEVALRRAADDLNKSGHRWALVGGFAVSARVEPRSTSGIAMAVMVTDDRDAERLVRSLITDGYAIFSSIEHDSGRLSTVRMTRAFDGADIAVNLLFASSGIEPEVAQAADLLEISAGLVLPVATTGHLIALKVLARDDTRRPQDLTDLRALLAGANADDLASATAAVALIEARGFNRGRDLRAALDDLRADLGT